MSNSNSFLLLRWLIDEKVSIEPFSSAKKGTKVYTGVFGEFKWSGKFYEAEVLKISEDKQQLNCDLQKLLDGTTTREEVLLSDDAKIDSTSHSDDNKSEPKAPKKRKSVAVNKSVKDDETKKPKKDNAWSKIKSAKQRAMEIFDSSQDEFEATQSQHQKVDSNLISEVNVQHQKVNVSKDDSLEVQRLTEQQQKDKATIATLEEELNTLKKQLHATGKDQPSRVSSDESHPSSSQTRHIYSINDEHFQMSSTYSYPTYPYAGYQQPYDTAKGFYSNDMYTDNFDDYHSSYEHSSLDYECDKTQYHNNATDKALSKDVSKNPHFDLDSDHKQSAKQYAASYKEGHNLLLKTPSRNPAIKVESPMVELVPGHGIRLTKRQLDAAHMNAPTPSRLIRNLMGVFFTPETLAVSSACGNRVNPALDKDIVETCIYYVQTKFEGATRSHLIDQINDRCANFRRKRKPSAPEKNNEQ